MVFKQELRYLFQRTEYVSYNDNFISMFSKPSIFNNHPSQEILNTSSFNHPLHWNLLSTFYMEGPGEVTEDKKGQVPALINLQSRREA